MHLKMLVFGENFRVSYNTISQCDAYLCGGGSKEA